MKKCFILLVAIVSMMSGTLQAQNSYNLEEILAEINADSLLRTVVDLQNFGSRFAAREGGNRDVAEYLIQRLNAYGCTTEIDSFYLQGYYSTIGGIFIHQWFYNVKGVLPAENPIDDSLVLVGSHLDAIAFGIYNSLVDAPGADDNASGVAVMIELARVCHEKNLRFRRDIHFMAFDLEELGLCGSVYDAKKRSENGEKIALMMNNDMVSYQPDDDWKLYLYWYDNARDVVSRAAVLCAQYTDLIPVIASDLENEHNARSDSYSFYHCGYRAIFAHEYIYSTSYHTGHDVADSNNYDYLAEVTRYNMVMLAAYANPVSGITNLASAIRVYPNPTRDKVTMQYILDENTPVHIAVFDMHGRIVFRKDKAMQENGLHHLELDLSDLTAGLYVIRVHTSKGFETFKVVRE